MEFCSHTLKTELLESLKVVSMNLLEFDPGGGPETLVGRCRPVRVQSERICSGFRSNPGFSNTFERVGYMSTILEMRDVRLKRRELYRKMEGMALTQREFTPEETAAFEALRQQVEALDERLMALEDQQVAVEEGASRSSRRLTGPVPIGRNVPGQNAGRSAHPRTRRL